MKNRLITLVTAAFCGASALLAQNPYLPLWEYIPDGEPYVFEDPDRPGEYRVYIYGSHDSLKDVYCGREQVLWSAPVDDLCSWRYDGVIFVCDRDRDGKLLSPDGTADVLYAPDVAMRMENGRKMYYLFPNVQGERGPLVAKAERPDGPFRPCNWSAENPRLVDGVLGFDPAVFVDDDGRVYGYWGFGESWAAEFDPSTMATVKPGCQAIHNLVSGQHQEGVFRFFEASSMRKIKDKYVFVYSRMMQDGEFGLPQCNYNLAWAYSDSPLGPFTYGGTLIDARARGVDDEGNVICTANPYGNTHGSLCEINGRWWVFYHRQCGTDEFSRQAMVAPVNIEVEEGPGGKVCISEAEYTSEGFRTEGLDPLQRSAAGWACYLRGPSGVRQEYPHFRHSGSYVQASRMEKNNPVVNNTAGSVVGYKYFNFNKTFGAKRLELVLGVKDLGVGGEIRVMVGGPSAKQGGKEIAKIKLEAGKSELRAQVNALGKIKGKQGLYFIFESSVKERSLCDFHYFQFIRR
ncbi:MAG: family 43 glycosylhydrolase [Bacteroidales bacterium]|nr:family 43 glycosylhydrolase [Bacteroidales bacterium]